MTFYEEIADSIMETPAFSKKVSKVGDIRILNVASLRELLATAAKMGAEASLGLVDPDHKITMELVCGVCREAIVAKDIDENHSVWEHKHD